MIGWMDGWIGTWLSPTPGPPTLWSLSPSGPSFTCDSAGNTCPSRGHGANPQPRHSVQSRLQHLTLGAAQGGAWANETWQDKGWPSPGPTSSSQVSCPVASSPFPQPPSPLPVCVATLGCLGVQASPGAHYSKSQSLSGCGICISAGLLPGLLEP